MSLSRRRIEVRPSADQPLEGKPLCPGAQRVAFFELRFQCARLTRLPALSRDAQSVPQSLGRKVGESREAVGQRRVCASRLIGAPLRFPRAAKLERRTRSYPVRSGVREAGKNFLGSGPKNFRGIVPAKEKGRLRGRGPPG